MRMFGVRRELCGYPGQVKDTIEGKGWTLFDWWGSIGWGGERAILVKVRKDGKAERVRRFFSGPISL